MIARFYDPLGLIGPVLTKAKILLQDLWKDKLHWDEALPQVLHTSWIEFCSQFVHFKNFVFPRYVFTYNTDFEIHGFCDASISAYGACIYLRSTSEIGVRVHLMCSKSRVAPLKVLTVPKLELSGALLLSELLQNILKK